MSLRKSNSFNVFGVLHPMYTNLFALDNDTYSVCFKYDAISPMMSDGNESILVLMEIVDLGWTYY